MTKTITMADFIGKTFTDIQNNGNELLFKLADGSALCMHHEQDCCETVWLEDVVGDLDDLVGSPILGADVYEGTAAPDWSRVVPTTATKDPHDYDTYFMGETWTFYKFRTLKGYVDLRWIGESNGYYSEAVDLKLIPAP